MLALHGITDNGHSHGTATAWRETAVQNDADADAVIGTGWANTIQTEPPARFFPSFVPHQVAKPGRYDTADPLYLAGLPGHCGQDYLYDLDNVDPEMLTYDDEVLEDAVPAGEGATFYHRYGAVPIAEDPLTDENLELPLSDQTEDITIPTFQINGENELFFCGFGEEDCVDSASLQLAESEYFSPDACYRAAVTPDAGHNLNHAAERVVHLRHDPHLRRSVPDISAAPRQDQRAGTHRRTAHASPFRSDDHPPGRSDPDKRLRRCTDMAGRRQEGELPAELR